MFKVGSEWEEQWLRGRGGYRGCFRGRRGGTSGWSFNKTMVKFYKCQKLGHFQSECPDWERGVNYAEIKFLDDTCWNQRPQ